MHLGLTVQPGKSSFLDKSSQKMMLGHSFLRFHKIAPFTPFQSNAFAISVLKVEKGMKFSNNAVRLDQFSNDPL